MFATCHLFLHDTHPKAFLHTFATIQVTPVRDQGQLGSCWDFATTGAYEARYLILTGGQYPDAPEYDFSEQQVLDCCDNKCTVSLHPALLAVAKKHM